MQHMNKKPTNGKGSKRRPTDEEAYRKNHGNIFGPPMPIELRPYDAEPTPHQRKSNLEPGKPDGR